MILVPSHYEAEMCRRFAQTHGDLPGKWEGIEKSDLRHLLDGPGDRSTAAGWMQDKLYDSAWIEVTQNSRYRAPDGAVFRISHDDAGNLILIASQEG